MHAAGAGQVGFDDPALCTILCLTCLITMLDHYAWSPCEFHYLAVGWHLLHDLTVLVYIIGAF